MNQYFYVLVRENYVRGTEVYNASGMLDTNPNRWEAAALPLWVGVYIASSTAEAIQKASAESGIVQEALIALI